MQKKYSLTEAKFGEPEKEEINLSGKDLWQ